MFITRALRSLICCVYAASVAFASTNELRLWEDYRTIMWISGAAYKQPGKVPVFFQRLREMGINTAMVHGDGPIQPLLDNRFPYYVENMVTRGLCLKFQSNVTDWDKFVTDWNATGRGEKAFVRDYCFDDPKWRGAARTQMESLVRKNMSHAPLAYDIRDELSTTISANPFDYDFNPLALAGFRKWLQQHYASLAALNEEWETRFRSWEEVRPFSTDQIKNRLASGDALPRGKTDWPTLQHMVFEPEMAIRDKTRWNFSPWCDFRTYMDVSLAHTLSELRDAARSIDPATPVGIEGTQMPSAWGGYDLWRLSQVLDWVEPYDIGNAREILGSFMPGKPLMTTVFEKDTEHARRRLWHLLLEGDRGCLVWWSEDCIDWKSPDCALTPKGRALSPVLKEMTSPLAHIFLRAERARDPVFIVYSHPSVQVDWLIESIADRASWHRRFSSFEAQHNVMAMKRNGWLKLLQDEGYSPRFVGADELPELARSSRGAVFVLSDARALSSPQVKAAEEALKNGATFLMDGPAGVFDEHGKIRAQMPEFSRRVGARGVFAVRLSGGTTRVATNGNDIVSFAKVRNNGGAGEWHRWLNEEAGIAKQVRPEVRAPWEKCVRAHRFKLGDARLIGLERNIDYHMSEDLKQAGGNEMLEKPVEFTAELATGGHVYDVRSGRYLGETNRITCKLDPWEPSLFAIWPGKISGEPVRVLSR